MNVVSGHAPQVGCGIEETKKFWSKLDKVVESIPSEERDVIGADFNGHVGEREHRRLGNDRQAWGQAKEPRIVVGFAKIIEMAVVNTYFPKREEHRVTYTRKVGTIKWTTFCVDDAI